METAAPILVLGAEPRIAVSIARCLASHHLSVDVATLRPGERAPSSRWIRSTLALTGREPEPGDLEEALLAAVGRHGYGHLVATSDSALRILTRAYEQLPGRIQACVPAPEVISTVLDKDRSAAMARASGLAVPVCWRIPSLEVLAQCRSELRFPMVAKPANKQVGEPFKVRYFQNLAALEHAFVKQSDFGALLLFQEYAPGEGIGIEVLMHQGQPVCAFQHRRIRELPWAGGISVVAESEPVDPELYEQSVTLLRELGGEGVCMVEFRRDPRTGAAVFMEVNARAYGSLSLSELCGIAFPWYHWQLLNGQCPAPPPTYRVGLRWRWSAGVLLRLTSLNAPGPPWQRPPSALAELGRAAVDLLPPTRDAIWTWSDPGPALSELRDVGSVLIRRGFKGFVRRVVPDRVIKRVQVFRYTPREVHRWRWRRYLGRGCGNWKPRTRLSPDQITSVLFVCHGNILRSPVSEHLLRRELSLRGGPARQVRSAGLRARAGREAHPDGLQAAADLGIDLSAHRAQGVTEDLLQAFDLVIVMDFTNEAELLARYPWMAARTVVIGDLAPGVTGVEVPDPYGAGIDAVRQRYEDLQRRVTTLAGWLEPHTPDS